MIPLLDMYKERWHVESEQVIKPGLTAIQFALAQLGHPEKQLPVVHFAGTNGKGSTLAFVEGIARAYGLSVGKFMSPCIVDVHDQIQLNGEPISAVQMDRFFKRLADANLSGKLTDFELLTVIAFLYFAEEKPDLVLLEAGMGGREDSTNVVMPLVSVIPSIALEHTNFLGDTLASIASHKAGIFKAHRPAVIGEMPAAAAQVFEQEARLKNVPLYCYGTDFTVTKTNAGETYENKAEACTIDQLQRQLLGAHQGHNMALAITAFLQVAAALALPVDEQKIRRGISSAVLAGRFEQVLPGVYFDGAHNPASIKAFVQTIEQQFPGRRIELIIGLLADKDVPAILRLLETVGDAFYFARIDNERAMDPAVLFEQSRAKEKSIAEDVLSLVKSPLEEQTIRLVTGSLYLLSDIRRGI